MLVCRHSRRKIFRTPERFASGQVRVAMVGQREPDRAGGVFLDPVRDETGHSLGQLDERSALLEKIAPAGRPSIAQNTSVAHSDARKRNDAVRVVS